MLDLNEALGRSEKAWSIPKTATSSSKPEIENLREEVDRLTQQVKNYEDRIRKGSLIESSRIQCYTLLSGQIVYPIRS